VPPYLNTSKFEGIGSDKNQSKLQTKTILADAHVRVVRVAPLIEVRVNPAIQGAATQHLRPLLFQAELQGTVTARSFLRSCEITPTGIFHRVSASQRWVTALHTSVSERLSAR
jgi:hypothetical protein